MGYNDVGNHFHTLVWCPIIDNDYLIVILVKPLFEDALHTKSDVFFNIVNWYDNT